MWKSIKNKFEFNDIHPDYTRALVALIGNDQPQLFHHRGQPRDGNRFDIGCYGDILIGIRIPRVDTQYWGFSQKLNVLNLIIGDEKMAMEITPDKFTYFINRTHPLIFIGHFFKSEIVASTPYPHIDFVWCNLPNFDRLHLASSRLVYCFDDKTIFSDNDKTNVVHGKHELQASSNIKEIIVPNLAMIL